MTKIGYIKDDEMEVEETPVISNHGGIDIVEAKPEEKKEEEEEKGIDEVIVLIRTYDPLITMTPKILIKDGLRALLIPTEKGDCTIVAPNRLEEIAHEFAHYLEGRFGISALYKMPERFEDLAREIGREVLREENAHRLV